MLSCISNSKRHYRRYLISFFLTVVFMFLLANVVLYCYFYGRTTATWYINNMPSKERHMMLNLQGKPSKDAIFIGNSRTLFQISTNLMSQQKINIYNLGVSGHALSDFPSMVASALEYHPKTVVLCLDAVDFYSPLGVPRDVDTADFRAYFHAHLDKITLLKSMLQYLERWNLIYFYATNINIRVQSFYKSMERLYSHESFSYLKNSLKNKMFLDRSNTFDKKYVHCSVFSMAHPKYIKAVGMCTNGDGILQGDLDKKTMDKDVHLTDDFQGSLDQQHLKLLNYLLYYIRQQGVKPIVVFTPVFHPHYPVGYIRRVVEQIHASVIDATHLRLSDAMWANEGHLNYKGRDAYTRYIADVFNERSYLRKH